MHIIIFLVCEKFRIEREYMLHSLDIISLPSDINCLLYGNTTLTDSNNNMKIIEIVQNYIEEIRRFTTD